MEDREDQQEGRDRYSYLIEAAKACQNEIKTSISSANEFMWTVQGCFLESDIKIEALDFPEWAKAARKIFTQVQSEETASLLAKQSVQILLDTLTWFENSGQHQKQEDKKEKPRKPVVTHRMQNIADILCGPANPEAEWDQRNYESFRRSLSPRRLEDDKAALSEVFAEAARVPMLADALDWALENDIRFHVDYTTSFGAYYTNFTGVVALSAKCFSQKQAELKASLLGHELTHALQDYRGALSRGEGFIIDFMKITTIEIAAYEFQWTSENQYNPAQSQFPRRHAPDLALGFDAWQRHSYLALDYGQRLALNYGEYLGLDVKERDMKIEMASKPIPPRPRRDRPIVTLRQIFDAINCDFKGNPWFDTHSPAVTRVKEAILDPFRAACFYRQDCEKPSDLVSAICAKQGTDLSRRVV